MLKYVLTASVAAVVQADICSDLTLAENKCPTGYKAVDPNTLLSCKSTICYGLITELFGEVRGESQFGAVFRQGYQCHYLTENATGLTTYACEPEMPPPPPAPTPAEDCQDLVYSRESCPPGSSIVNLATLTQCKNYLCKHRLDPYGYAHSSDNTKIIAGQGYGCQMQDWNGKGLDGMICMLGQPYDCASLKNVTGSCPAGTSPVETHVLTTCKDYLCENVLGQFGLAHGADPYHALVGQAQGCKIQATQGPIGVTICGAN